MSTDKKDRSTNRLLSDLTDINPNIYEMTRDLARIAKQIKKDTNEEAEPPQPVLEAVSRMHDSQVETA